MNDQKIDFIICYNDEIGYLECKRYINDLIIPEDIRIDIIGIDDAKSLAEGYNRAMHSSDAKYKVYLHQDVFIINPHFIEDVIVIFKKDDSIGMIGVLGRSERDISACYWKTWDTGRTYAATPATNVDMNFQCQNKGIQNVVVIDGMIMITQYDVEWREDVLDGFDYYDISQSEEFLRSGYRIVIPFQEKPWCLHDCGVTNLTKYDHYRKIFCESYNSLGYKYEISETLNNRVKMSELASRIYEIASHSFESGDYSAFDSLMEEFVPKVMNFSTKFEILFIFWKTLRMEWASDSKELFFTGKKLEDLALEYTTCKRLIRRIEFDRGDATDEDTVKEYISTMGGRIFLYNVTTYSALNPDTVLKRVFQ